LNRKLIVIGIDGGTYDIFDPAMEKGLMPNMKSLTESGVKGPLWTIIPPITGPAWVSFATGLNPGKHGTLSFFKPFSKDNKDKFQVLTSQNIDGLAFWDIMAAEGVKTVILNIPQTFPPYPFDGIMVTKIESTGPNRMASYPPEWKDRINRDSGVPSDWCLQDGISQTPQFLEHLIESLRNDIKINRYLLEETESEVFVSATLVMDGFLHHFWRFIDPSHRYYDRDMAQRMAPLVDEFYRAMDDFVGLLLENGGEDTTFCMVSDHGFGPAQEVVHINNWLIENGWLVEDSNSSGLLKKIASMTGMDSRSFVDKLIKLDVLNIRTKLRHSVRGPMREAIENAMMKEFDWEKSMAYFPCTADFGIHMIPPFGNSSRQELREKLISQLDELRDEDGRPVFKEIHRREDIFQGPHLEEAPDIILIPSGPRICIAEPSKGPLIQPQKHGLVNGFHRQNGVFALKGPGIKSGETFDDARIIDIAPTLLYLLGIPVDENMDGKVLTECLTGGALDGRPVEKRKYNFDKDSRKVVEDFEDDTLDVQKRLRGLGYMD